MQLTDQHKKVLKELSKLNTQAWLCSNTIGIVDNEKSICGFYDWGVTLQKDFGVYDLSELLGILSLYKDATITEGDTELTIESGSLKTQYRHTAKDCIVVPPEKSKFEDMFKGVKDSATIPSAVLTQVKEHSSIIKAPHIILEGSTIVCKDNDNPSSNCVTFEVEGAKFSKTILLRENIIKVMDGDYTVRCDGNKAEMVGKEVTYYTVGVSK